MEAKVINLKANISELQDPEKLAEVLRDQIGEIPDEVIQDMAETIVRQTSEVGTVLDLAHERFDEIKDMYKKDLKEILPKGAPKDLRRFAWFSMGFKQGWDAAKLEEEDDE